MDGVAVLLTDGKFTVKADGKSHTVEIADKAGNTAVFNVTLLCTKHTGGTATCTEEGKCAVCGEAYIPMSEHETELRGSKAATKDEEGYTGDTVCKHCDTVIGRGEPIPKLPAPPTHGDGGGPNVGAMVAVIIGSAVAVALGGFAVFWFAVKKKKWSDLMAVFKHK